MSGLENANDEQSIKSTVNEILSVDKQYGKAEARIALDFYFNCYCFCKENAFSARKIATFLSIMHEAFLRDALNRYPSWSLQKSYEFLQDVIFRHSVERSPKRFSI